MVVATTNNRSLVDVDELDVVPEGSEDGGAGAGGRGGCELDLVGICGGWLLGNSEGGRPRSHLEVAGKIWHQQ